MMCLPRAIAVQQVMKFVRTCRLARAVLLAQAALLSATGQMHRVDKPEQVTRAVGVYEYVGDLQHPKAARLIPVSLFIGGHFEDAGVYLARPIPFALDGGLRYELQKSGIRQDYLDVVASRNFAGSAVAAATPFDDGWFGYGRIVPPTPPKAGKLRPNCGNAHTVQEAGTKDDGKPHFGSKPSADDTPKARGARNTAPDPCRDDDEDRPEKVTLADDKRDANSPDPERPTLHRSPETSAHNTGAQGKPDKKAPKPPPATITANGGPGDDPDRPTIRHRTASEDDPNALPPDPIELASREQAKSLLAPASTTGSETTAPKQSELSATGNDTVAEGGNIRAGDTASGAPVLRRGRLTAPAPEAPPAAQNASSASPSVKAAATPHAGTSSLPEPLDAVVAVSDAKERPAHDFSYHFASPAERATALGTLQTMARAVLANPALATDASEGLPAPQPASATQPTRNAPSSTAHATARSGTRPAVVHSKPRAPLSTASTPLTLADEQMAAYQLYFGAPVTYTYSARVPAAASTPERFVTVIAQTDADGHLQPAIRSVTDAAHLDRIPRYRLVDVVDADGSNRASLLMELRAQHTRQFALYRLFGNKPDQIFVTGSTLL